MSQRFAADQELQLLQSIGLESFDGEYSDFKSDELNNVIADIQNEEDSSDSDDEYANQKAAINTDDSTRAQSSSDNDEQILLSEDGSHWRRSVPSQVTAGQLQQHNIVRSNAKPTSYFTSSIIRGSPLSSFRILFNEPMLRNIQKCTISKAHRAIGNNSWTVTLDELDKFMELIVARGVICERTLPIKSIWDKSWGFFLFNAIMPRWRFLRIIKFFRFDLKTEIRRNLEEKKFCLAYLLWNPFLENFQKAYDPNVNITIDKQLLFCTASCKFIQFMPNKPDKFGIKFWMAVDVESKYLYNGFSYLGKDWTRSGDASLPTNAVIKLFQCHV